MNAMTGLVEGLEQAAEEVNKSKKEPELVDFPCERAEAPYRIGDYLHLEGLHLIGELEPVHRAMRALKLQLTGITADGVLCVISRAEVAPYEGANPIPNPLYQLKIERKFEIRNGKIMIMHTFTNPTDKTMPLKGRLNNYLWPGHRFQANRLTLAGKVAEKLEIQIVKPEWKNEPFSVTADNGVLRESLRIEPDPKFAGLYSWSQKGEPYHRTMEFIFENDLPAGQSVKYTYTISKE